MDGEEPNFRAPPLTNLVRPINLDSSSSSSSSSSASHNSLEPDFLRNVQAAFKRHRSMGTKASSNLLPRRCVPSLRETGKSSELSSGLKVETKRSTIGETLEDASITPPSISGTITNTFDDKYNLYGREDQPAPSCKDVQPNILSHGELKHAPMTESLKKVQFSVATSEISHGADDRKATRMDDLSSHMGSLTLTEMEWDAVNQSESSKGILNEPNQKIPARTDGHGGLRVGGGSSLGTKMSPFSDKLHHLRNFLHTDVNHPITQSSVVGSSCATTTSVHATSAPMPNSTTYFSHPHKDSFPGGSIPDKNRNSQTVPQGDGVHHASSSIPSNRAISDRDVNGAQASNSVRDPHTEVKETLEGNVSLQTKVSHDLSQCQDQPMQEKGNGADAPSTRQPSPTAKDSSNPKTEPAKSEKQEKPPSRKRGYDPDMFFKVNGKLYQRLGKIGSGGSSEVHKVISSDCKIYALKKIRLKGRDYATAFGFCQEILYLNKLKGKSNIIQLIDYEVTDKALLQEVMNGYIKNKDSKVKDDGYIYMVLEYGEIDLAHMLSQKWKDIEGSNSTIDENWLRFYWQQILQAVNTIHEERIVHSDLKPANFLLVKGSLKLIDFGIAKAIMSDTTNIQRDAQVGTLSYMSPEAFMCNESDEEGNVIKCGRPSDIWSLGCILYQMVYGRTPFSEYRTFWAKFKVITDPNHEIKYGPLSNPWLLDLMKKCLSWDRNQRWRIPELLEHPFLVPPVPSQIEGQNSKAIQLIAESCESNPEASALCSQLQQLLGDQTIVSRDQQCRLLSKISSIFQELQEQIAKNS